MAKSQLDLLTEKIFFAAQKPKELAEFLLATFATGSGAQGEKGEKGDPGEDGADGFSVLLSTTALTASGTVQTSTLTNGTKAKIGDTVIDSAGNVFSITQLSGTTATLSEIKFNIKGAKGDKGATGANGADGATGAAGTDGKSVTALTVNMDLGANTVSGTATLTGGTSAPITGTITPAAAG